jgi:single-stranded DNA-binding protein
MPSIEVAFLGTVVKDAAPKVSAAGKKYMRLNMRVGDSDNCQWVMVTVFGDTVDEIAGYAVKGMPLYIEGRLTLDTWKAQDGTDRSGLSVAAWRCKPPEIGRRKVRKAKTSKPAPESTSIIPPQEASKPTFDDSIPF